MKSTNRKNIKNRIQIDFTTKSIFPFFKNYCKSLGMQDTALMQSVMTYKVYSRVLKALFKKLRYKMIYESAIIKLPYHMGLIYIKKKKLWVRTLVKHNKLKVDWGFYHKTGKRKFHLNEDRENYRYSITWRKTRVANMQNFILVYNRLMKRELAKILKTNTSIDYFERC